MQSNILCLCVKTKKKHLVIKLSGKDCFDETIQYFYPMQKKIKTKN